MEFWVRRLYSVLRRHPIVDKVVLKPNRLTVRYTTGFRRNYVFCDRDKRTIYRSDIERKDGLVDNLITVGYERQWRLENRPDLQKYFMVTRKVIGASTFMEQELMLHEVFKQIQRNGYIKPYYSDEEIKSDLLRIETIQHSYFHGTLTQYPNCGISRGRLKPGRALIETFFDLIDMQRSGPETTLRNAFQADRILYTALWKIIRMTRWDLTINNLHKMFSQMGYGPKWTNPVVYKVLLSHLCRPFGRVVTDPHPHLGSKALACAVLGAKYAPVGGLNCDEGFVERAGVQLVDQPDKHDIVLFDNGFSPCNIEEAMAWRGKCKDLIVYVPASDYQDMLKYKPTRTMRIKTKLATPKVFVPDHLFLFRS